MNPNQTIIPVLRIFDVEKAKAFYLDFLGFQLDWMHQFEENFPFYLQISKDQYCLHLTEHYGDCSPGALVRLHQPDLERFAEQLNNQNARFAKPQIETMPWGNLELSVSDPFSNRLVFWQDQAEA
ncbi:glyoxalase superfamily protein [Acinetobacter ihumii]|uniref:glyoxalase superfamily protein n=1 Tax=Acinetobacter ihumii TaxID=2483802 RepID=UPI00102FD04A|nr:glyoxalase superfamily protein [Acinetobacter ihumii]